MRLLAGRPIQVQEVRPGPVGLGLPAAPVIPADLESLAAPGTLVVLAGPCPPCHPSGPESPAVLRLPYPPSGRVDLQDPPPRWSPRTYWTSRCPARSPVDSPRAGSGCLPRPEAMPRSRSD